MAGIDLINGHVIGLVRERHRSSEFVEFLRADDDHYTTGTRIQIVLDDHSSHISEETRAYLDTKPSRFDFVFTPKHESWLNLVESFFAKMAKTMLSGVLVASKVELRTRIEQCLGQLNEMPTIFRRQYKIETLAQTLE